MEKVLTGPDAWRAIAATTAEESTPPDRNAPSGRSLIIRTLVASSSRSPQLLGCFGDGRDGTLACNRAASIG